MISHTWVKWYTKHSDKNGNHVQVDKSDINQIKNYYNICEKILKESYNNHRPLFRNKSKEKTTEPSKHTWELKNNSVNYDIKCL